MILGLRDIPTIEDLKKTRKNARITQKKLAEKAGVSQSLIARIEKGAVDPRLSTVQKIMRALIILSETKAAKDIMSGPVIMVESKEKIRNAVKLMRENNVSQLPVIIDGKVIGSIQESTIIEKLLQSRDSEQIFNENVETIMETGFATVNPSIELEEILALLSKGRSAVLVVDMGKVVGIITKIDVVSTLTHSKKGE